MRTVHIVGDDNHLKNLFKRLKFNIVSNQETADVVLWIGGADINPSFYNQNKNPDARVFSIKEHDDRDENAWKKIKTKQFKIGICRGGQFLNCKNGGKLYQNVSGHSSDHQIYDALWDTDFRGTSSHHQMMVPTTDGEVLAYADIGTNYLGEIPGEQLPKPEIDPEVIWYERTKTLCYQGHPEWTNEQSTEFKYFEKLIRKFIG